jgi:hypothetical protein
MPMPHWINETTICADGSCLPRNAAYEAPSISFTPLARIEFVCSTGTSASPTFSPASSGTMPAATAGRGRRSALCWPRAPGYRSNRCVQPLSLLISCSKKQQVRDHTRNCGGHDSEILSCNIDEAWTNLKIDYEAFAYDKLPVPQTDAFGVWLKQQLAAGHVVAWMIMWNGQTYVPPASPSEHRSCSNFLLAGTPYTTSPPRRACTATLSPSSASSPATPSMTPPSTTTTLSSTSLTAAPAPCTVPYPACPASGLVPTSPPTATGATAASSPSAKL